MARKSRKKKQGPKDRPTLPVEAIREEREGKDEMNLAVFPIAALYSRVPRNIRSLKFRDTIIGENGKVVRRTWTVQGGSEVGLPTSTDEDVYVALMELTRKQGFGDQKVPFSRYDLVKRLGWCPCGKCYRRLEESLLRLSNVFIHAQNAFWDNAARAYVTVGFTLIQGYHLYDETVRRKSGTSQPMSWIMWSDQLYRSFKSGYIKFLDTDLYFRLRTATARRLYRYLDKKFGADDRFSIDIFKLAHEHLGLSRNFRYISEITRQLTPALEELTQEGYLRSWKVEDRMISFVKSKAARYEPFDTTDEQMYRTLDLPFESVRALEDGEERAEAIVGKLVERGVIPSQARKIVEAQHENLDAVEATIRYFDGLMSRGGGGIKNPAGLLVTLIKDGRAEPVKLVEGLSAPPPRGPTPADELSYQEFIQKAIDGYIESQGAASYEARREAKRKQLLSSDQSGLFKRWSKQAFEDYVSVLCQRDIAAELNLPDFQTWLAAKKASEAETELSSKS
jgi:plasmid replication initiation protein